jgi:hypothetical protein
MVQFAYPDWYEFSVVANQHYLPQIDGGIGDGGIGDGGIGDGGIGDGAVSRADRIARYALYARRQDIGSLMIKRRVLAKRPELMTLFADELAAYSGAAYGGAAFVMLKTNAQHLRFTIPCFAVDAAATRAFCQGLHAHLTHCVRVKWAASIVFEKGTLQALLIEYLKRPDQRLAASVHFAAKHGARATLDLLDTVDNVWALRF